MGLKKLMGKNNLPQPSRSYQFVVFFFNNLIYLWPCWVFVAASTFL